jgi:hypothetical protein
MDATCSDCLFSEERADSNLRPRPWCQLWEIWDPQELPAGGCDFGELARPAAERCCRVAAEVQS